jgi:GR25 family glycosyltransferase involved in LPS biosynthesis
MSAAREASASLIVQIVTCRKSAALRLDSATASLAALQQRFEIDVVQGFTGEDPVVDSLHDGASKDWRTKRPLSRSEIAVYASHRLAWRRLLEGPHAAALVLEDDFGLRDPAGFAEIVNNWSAVLGDGRDIVKLFDFEKRRKNRPALSRRIANIELVKWRAPTAGMVAYLISRNGAEKFLRRERIFRQVDEDTKYFWELGLDIWSVPGNPVVEISAQLGGSTVDAERDEMKMRHLMRSLWGNLITADRKIRTRAHLLREQLRRP